MRRLYTVGLVLKRVKDLPGDKKQSVLQMVVFTGLFASPEEAGIIVAQKALKDDHPDFQVEECKVFEVPDYAVFEASRELANGGK